MSFTRILCPIDFSPQSPVLVRHALGLAAGPSARVVVLHVVEPLLLQAATMTGAEARLRADITHGLQDVVGEAIQSVDLAPSIDARITEGAPHEAILDTSAREACDLIVMGTHGASGLAKACFGSTLERVLRSTTVPVAAIPPRGIRIVGDRGRLAVTDVVAAIDFEQPSMAAACAAASYARRHGARLTLLHVMVAAPSWGPWRDAAGQQHALRRERAEHELAVLAAELSHGGPPTVTVVLEGSAWERIAAYGGDRPGTLVVMGLRSERGRAMARPGAVAYRVLCAGAHPVLVVPSKVCARLAA